VFRITYEMETARGKEFQLISQPIGESQNPRFSEKLPKVSWDLQYTLYTVLLRSKS
jgi:hypothetical protein